MYKYLLMILSVLTVFVFVSSPALRADAKGLTPEDRIAMALRIKAGAGIHVESYQKDSNTYEVRIEGEPDVGPNITTPEWLLEGIDNGMSIETLKRNPQRVVGGYFRLKKTLWLLDDDEIEARKKSKKK